MLADDLAGFYDDPLGYVMYIFPWDTEKSIQMVKLAPEYRERFPNCEYGPDVWACEFLDQWGAEIKKRGFTGEKAVDPIQFSTASGHGIGKSVLAAWIVKFIMDTRPFSQGTVTANTDTQLRTKTWATLGAWHKLSLTVDRFQFNTGRGAMSFFNKDHPDKWKCTAQTCREENSESFAGQHASNATSFYIFDEASAVPDKIFEVREGGLVTGEPMTFDFGNPTRNSGKFFEQCVGKLKHRYIVRQIDSRTVAITNKELHKRWIEDNGIDSDFVKVRIRGMFPSAGNLQFIPTVDVEAAMERDTFVSKFSPLIIGVDVARFGDDETVIYPRIGDDARSFAPTSARGRYRGLDTVQVTGKVIETIKHFEALGKSVSGLFVDEGGIGSGVVDQLRHLGYPVTGVQFGGGAVDKQLYRFKSDEMWGKMKEALHTRLAIPLASRNANAVEANDTGTVLKDQLTQREFGYTLLGNKIHLEAKKEMKERLGGDFSSPDVADALALTFAMDVATVPDTLLGSGAQAFVKSDYDPLEQDW
jgi:hypothetical protein